MEGRVILGILFYYFKYLSSFPEDIIIPES